MIECDIGISFADARYHFAPEDAILQNVCLINARHLFSAQSGRFKRHMSDTLNFGCGNKPSYQSHVGIVGQRR